MPTDDDYHDDYAHWIHVAAEDIFIEVMALGRVRLADGDWHDVRPGTFTLGRHRFSYTPSNADGDVEAEVLYPDSQRGVPGLRVRHPGRQ